MAEEKKTRRSRYFIYNDGKNVVTGKQSVRYEPDASKCMFGSCSVEIYFPRRREAKHSFRLDLYPTINEKNPSENIVEDVDVGCRMLFVESNRSAGLQVRSICKISREDFSYENFSIIPDSIMSKPNSDDASELKFLKAVFMHKSGFFRKGDTVEIIDCKEDENKKICWYCKWNPCAQKFSKFESIRKFWFKLFKKDLYRQRYFRSAHVDVSLGDLKIIDCEPFEKETKRDDD